MTESYKKLESGHVHFILYLDTEVISYKLENVLQSRTLTSTSSQIFDNIK